MKTPFPLNPLPFSHSHSRGFTLIVTMTLMVLLAMISIGLLSLSTISMRNASSSEAKEIAKANARLALMLAIGQLQKHAGSDTRVTAPSGIITQNGAPLTGVWRSWEGTNHETSGDFAGRPIKPNYGKKRETFDPASANDKSNGRFLSWLVSGAADGELPSSPESFAKNSADKDYIPLLSEGTLGDTDPRKVYVAPSKIEDTSSYAWWVSGENQKVRFPKPYQPEDSSSIDDWAVIAKSHQVADTKPFGLDTLLTDSKLAEKVLSLGSGIFTSDKTNTKFTENFHDISSHSTGLLTNTANGGWRKDFSLLSESWENQPSSNQPFFQITPSKATSANIPRLNNPLPERSIFYPWSAYLAAPDINPTFTTEKSGAVANWANLMDWATHYKRVTRSGAGLFTGLANAENIGGDNHSFHNKHRIYPVVARIQWVLSHGADSVDNTNYTPTLYVKPAVTMWNPYNIKMDLNDQNFIIVRQAFPTALQYNFDGTDLGPDHQSIIEGNSNRPGFGKQALKYNFPAFNLLPGETRIFGPANEIDVKHQYPQGVTPNTFDFKRMGEGHPEPSYEYSKMDLEPGLGNGKGHKFYVLDKENNKLNYTGSTMVSAAVKFDTKSGESGGNNVGIVYDFGKASGKRTHNYRMMYDPAIALALDNFKAIDREEMPTVSLLQCSSSPVPFLSMLFGARMASSDYLPTKGFVQSSPLSSNTKMGIIAGAFSSDHTGRKHPINAPYDYSFIAHADGAGGAKLPNSDGTTNSGYIVSGYNAQDGLSRCVAVELPLRPVSSLVELTHWNLRYENPCPPFGLNHIGNSDATPLLPPDSVTTNNSLKKTHYQHDDSYCANHLLFDDWFASSIAPDPPHQGASARSQEQVYTDFLQGTTPLANRAYRPISEDVERSSGDNDAYDKHVKPVDSWKKIASRFEVEGMFNVNSVSAKAWRALLGHARGKKIPYIKADGGVVLSQEEDHVWNRFSIAGDKLAGTAVQANYFAATTEFTGYRKVTDTFLDQLSVEIVKQVQARGPFLSLAEFMNRQLSAGDLALAGTVQAALNELTKTGSNTDLFATLKDISADSVENPKNATDEISEDYKFPEAAVGDSSYGMPGWTRQADILRPLAPILSARDDTFTIRAYGDSKDKSGKIIAKAWCEATVARSREFVDSNDEADRTTQPENPINQLFGRRFKMISFRWISEKEV